MNNGSRMIAIISYITWFGLFIAYLAGDRADRFFMHHMNQALVVQLAGLAAAVLNVIPVLGNIASVVISTGLFVLDIMGIIRAYRGSTEPLPFIGDIHLIG